MAWSVASLKLPIQEATVGRVPSVCAVVVTSIVTAVASHATKPCEVTKPNGVMAGAEEVNPHSYGNQRLSVGPFGLWPDGTVVFRPDGPGFMTRDGSLGMKFGWTRRASGKLKIEGRRLDAPAPPLRAEIGSDNQDSGFVATSLVFSTPGCWEVTGRVGDASVTFVTMVTKIGDGPSWRREIR
ncbi:MAG TPA: hypothetical protein VIX35_12180 [Vicinamibacterales bacterium]